MKLDTIEYFAEDNTKAAIALLESRGFYLLPRGWKASKTKRKARRRYLRQEELLPHRGEERRALWRRQQATFKGRWKHMRRTYREGFMSFEEWALLWGEAGDITLGDGTKRPAWKMRAKGNAAFEGGKEGIVQMRRWDTKKPYSLDNVYVEYKNRVLADGYELSLEIAEQKINDIQE